MGADALQPLFEHLQVRAETFFTGTSCTVGRLERLEGRGYLHIVRRGRGEVWFHRQVPPFRIAEPLLLFCPGGLAHQIVPEGSAGLDLVCATISYGPGMACALVRALPAFMPLGLDRIGPVAELLVLEALGSEDGRLAVVNRLCEVLLIHLIRDALDRGKAQGGLLAGLGHPRLRRALLDLHGDPSHPWTLAELSRAAGMSRSSFAADFKATLGVTPGGHLRRFRVALAQDQLAQGLSVKQVALDLGYCNSAAFSRAFRSVTGTSPLRWLHHQALQPAVAEAGGDCAQLDPEDRKPVASAFRGCSPQPGSPWKESPRMYHNSGMSS